MMKHANHTILQPKVKSSKCFFCVSSSPEQKDIQLVVMYDNWKLQILILIKLVPENDEYFSSYSYKVSQFEH